MNRKYIIILPKLCLVTPSKEIEADLMSFWLRDLENYGLKEVQSIICKLEKKETI